MRTGDQLSSAPTRPGSGSTPFFLPDQGDTVDTSLLLSSELALHKMCESLLRLITILRHTHVHPTPLQLFPSLLSGSTTSLLPTPPWSSTLIPKPLWSLSQQYADSGTTLMSSSPLSRSPAESSSSHSITKPAPSPSSRRWLWS
jgi:hypothetical protein